MLKFDINVDRRTEGRTEKRTPISHMLQAGATKIPYMVYKTYKHKIQTNVFTSVTVHLKEGVCEKVSLSSLSFNPC